MINLRLFRSVVTQIVVPSIRLNGLPRPSFSINQLNYSTVTYKTPTNRAKIFKPTTVAVTNANKHLVIELIGKDEKNLGKMNMEKANELAVNSELKLVIIDESCSPPKFKLMTGHELYKAQIKVRDDHKNDSLANKVTKEKEIDLNLGISEHDFQIKLKMAQNFYDKGHPIRIKVLSKIINKREKNIPKLQEEFIEKLRKSITFAKLQVEKVSDNQAMIYIESKNAVKTE